jgi:4a-hydroxytetrahydrobiopterin dehydratase
MAHKPDTRLDDAIVIERLSRDLPGWTLAGGSIRRTYKTSGWKATLLVVNTVGHLCEAAWHHPDLAVSYASVEVALATHSANGITEKDLALARKIDEVVLWRPGTEGGPLEGTPENDPHNAYIAYD